jgi:hypothetical protein
MSSIAHVEGSGDGRATSPSTKDSGQWGKMLAGVAMQKLFRLPKIRLGADFADHESHAPEGGDPMTTLQAVVFGMMLSWTPSMALLAWCLWKERIGAGDI